MDNFEFLSRDGVSVIHGVIWKPEKANYPVPKAIIQLSHGMVEYIERYNGMARYLNEQGYVVFGNDHVGHGQSVNTGEDWGYFGDKDGGRLLVEDLHTVTEKAKDLYPGIPLILIGHSMGSFMVRRYIMEYGAEVDAAIIMGTGNQPLPLLLAGKTLVNLIGLFRGDRHRSTFASNVMFGTYNKKIPDASSPHAWISSDKEEVETYDANPACTFLFTINGMKMLMDTICYIKKKKHIDNIPKDLPILLLSGKEDPVGNYGRDVLRVCHIFRAAGIKNVHCRLYRDCRHELQNECRKEEVFSDIVRWIEARKSGILIKTKREG